MRRLVAFVALVIALFAVTFAKRADACENATLRDDPAYAALREAEEAIDEGDIARARELAMPVAEGTISSRFNPADTRARGQRIVAVTWVRDRAATPEEIDRAVTTLAVAAASKNPRDEAMLGEAFARAGMTEDAYQALEPLAKKDLIGSPYAYAALARVAAQRGDAGTSVLAKKRCAEMTSSAAICNGAYPAPPLLRGKMAGYVMPGIVVLFVLARRRLRKTKMPWTDHGAKLAAIGIVATCAGVFALARSPFTAMLVTTAALFFIGQVQRLFFVGSVKDGALAGWTLRDAAAEDGGLPTIYSFFHSERGVLERIPDASYREPARVPVLRLERRSRRAFVCLVAGVLMLALFGACGAALTFSSRSASVSERVSEG